ncbi:hypothetical protein [Siphonobacter sp. SORGH_AS_0500]|uniref:hypothetical protein n=1 Tax=Siphonobacter sp. SORGH_AS_0500 TaxID=1864824 RepID=UPI0028635679|nr:hypothetical protein [Siphonobacter sp. SORGH_AS_0500]MDR6195623.1 hypothetical protein [Siphonobacter sp. SORGH_AS_0500]
MLSKYEIPSDQLEAAQAEHWCVKGRTVNATQITEDAVAAKCIEAGSKVFKEKSESSTTSLAATEPAPALKEVEPEEPAGETEVKAGAAAKKNKQS